MIPIGVFSLVAVSVFLYRLMGLRTSVVVPDALWKEVCRHLRTGDSESAVQASLKACADYQSPLAKVLEAGLRRNVSSREEMKEAFEERGRFEVSAMAKGVEFLGTIAAVTPLIGLLGTVVGMIDVFRTVVAEVGHTAGAVNPGSLAGGIWAALLTTAAGLSVAIPTYLGYRYLQAEVDRLAIDMEKACVEVLDSRFAEHSSDDDWTSE